MTSVSLGSYAISTYENVGFSKFASSNNVAPLYNSAYITFNKPGFYIISIDNTTNSWCAKVMCVVYNLYGSLYCKALGRYNCDKTIYIYNTGLSSSINLDSNTNVLNGSNFIIAFDYGTTPPANLNDIGTTNMLISYHG